MPDIDEPLNEHVCMAVEMMNADIAHNFKIKDLSSSIGISRSHLTSLFNAAFGLPPYQWLLQRRLDAARTQIMEGPRSITDIALSCGFNSSQHFATAFRTRFGLSPSAYRRKWGRTSDESGVTGSSQERRRCGRCHARWRSAMWDFIGCLTGEQGRRETLHLPVHSRTLDWPRSKKTDARMPVHNFTSNRTRSLALGLANGLGHRDRPPSTVSDAPVM